MLKSGIYEATKDEGMFDRYSIKMKVKETDKSYILELLEFDSNYPPAHMELLFKDKKKVIIHKNKGGHAMRVWGDDNFTIYPFQAGIPFYFRFISPLSENIQDSILITDFDETDVTPILKMNF